MVLRELEGGAVAIGQASHAWICGQLARHWGNHVFVSGDPLEEVCLAAEQHDVGWAEWDLRPSLNPATGLPHAFHQIPLRERIALWRPAPAKLLSQSRYAAVLVSMHGTALHERIDLDELPEPERRLVVDYLREQDLLRRELLARLHADPEQLRRNQRLIWCWDSLSLGICMRWPEFALESAPVREGAATVEVRGCGQDTLTLDPWPFATSPVRVRFEGAVLHRRLTSDEELHRELAAAEPVTLVATLRPPPA